MNIVRIRERSGRTASARVCLLALLGVVGGVGCSSPASSQGAASDASTDVDGGALPTVTGPVTGGSGQPVTAALIDLAAYGYVEEEYFLEGNATAYDWLSPPGADGDWSVQPTTRAHYKTRILVRRPAAVSRFNGTVLIEWFNETGGVDADPEFGFGHVQLLREGFAYVGVSAQAEGVVGGGVAIVAAARPLVKADPARYGSLKHPGDDYAYDIFTQVAQVLRHPGAVDPLAGLRPAHLVGDGQSQSAIRMVTYVDAIQPLSKAFDGFFLHSRFGGGALLNGFADAGVNGILGGPSPARIRGDLTVPVFQFETETDVPGLASGITGVGFAVSRQPDTGLLRTWEVAGTAHADQYLLDYESGSDRADGGTGGSDASAAASLGCATPNEGPEHWVEDTALDALQTWVTGGQPPASGAPFVLADAGSVGLAQDANGNALGGVRTAAVDVPIATYSGQPGSSGLVCSFFGNTTPFSPALLASLYPTHDDYVSAVMTATAKAQQAGFILAADVPLIVAEASSAAVPQ